MSHNTTTQAAPPQWAIDAASKVCERLGAYGVSTGYDKRNDFAAIIARHAPTSDDYAMVQARAKFLDARIAELEAALNRFSNVGLIENGPDGATAHPELLYAMSEARRVLVSGK